MLLARHDHPLHPSPPRRAAGRRGRALGVVAVVVAVLVSSIGPASGQTDPVAAAESALADARQERVAYESELRRLEERRSELASEFERLGVVDAQLTDEIARARHQLREFAVEAYIDGGQSEIYRATLSLEQAQALAWASDLTSGQSRAANEAARRYQDLKDSTAPERLDAAEQLDQLDQQLAAARADAIQASALERDAEAELTRLRARAEEQAAAREREAAQRAADQETARREAARAVEAPTTTAPRRRPPPVLAPAPAPPAPAPPAPAAPSPAPPTGAGPTPAEAATLARIRQCESGGNYSIVSPSGRYRGAYQFDVATWQSVGGSGDPAAASPAEQDHRALLLLRARGTRPWPHCGR